MSKRKRKEKLETDNVKIGDTVLLYYNSKVDDKGDPRKDGYVITDLSGSSSQQLAVVKPNSTDIRLGTFKIVCTNNHEAQSRLRQNNLILSGLQKKCEDLYENYYDLYYEDSDGESDSMDEDFYDENFTDQGKMDRFELMEERIEAVEKKIKEAESEVDRTKAHFQVEKEENEAKQRQLKGNNICYGQKIQLLHTLTGKYLCVSTTESSRTEHSKLKVYLQREDSVGCIFRLHPHIKVESVGDEINYNDQLKFESLAVQGQYLHCSKKTFSKTNVTANSDCFELNISAKDSPLQIKPHYKTSREVRESELLRACGVVRFFNHKHHSYIVGEGSFAGRYCNFDDHISEDTERTTQSEAAKDTTQSEAAKEVADDEVKDKANDEVKDSAPSKDVPKVEEKDDNAKENPQPAIPVNEDDDEVIANDVHFKKKKNKLGLSNPPSTSPNTFWQIEKYSIPSSGEPITWKEECRIKHLPTKRYLAVITDPKDGYMVTLKSSKLKSETIFQLFPVVNTTKGDGTINFESYVRVQNKKTGTWLHMDKGYERTYNNLIWSLPMHGSDTFDYTERMFDRCYCVGRFKAVGQMTLQFTDDRRLAAQDKKYTSKEAFFPQEELYKIIASKNINLDDAFKLEKVAEDHVADFYYVASVTEVLSKQVQKCQRHNQGKCHTIDSCGHMKSTLPSLTYLNDLIQKDESSKKFKQKLIRSMSTLKLVVRLMNFHIAGDVTQKGKDEISKGEDDDDDVGYDDYTSSSDEEEDDNFAQKNNQKISTACFAIIISFLEGNSDKNRNYVSRFSENIFTFEAWKTELNNNLTIEEALIGVVKDNSYLIWFARSCVQVMTKKLQKTLAARKEIENGGDRFVRLLNGLSCLCICKGEPQKLIQDAIFEKIKSQKILYCMSHDFEDTVSKNGGVVDALDDTLSADARATEDVVIEMDDMPLIRAANDEPIKRERVASSSTDTDEIVELTEEVHDEDIFDFESSPIAKVIKLNRLDLDIDKKSGEVNIRILIAQFKLFVVMCRGNNTEFIKYLKDGEGSKRKIGVKINLEFILNLLEELSLFCPKLRPTLVELLKVMYVEVGNDKPFLEKIPYSFKIDQVFLSKTEVATDSEKSKEDAATALTGEKNENFDTISQLILANLKENYENKPFANDTVANETTVQLLQLLYTLVKYGYYDEENRVEKLLPYLFSFLYTKGNNDSLPKLENREEEEQTARDGGDKTKTDQEEAGDQNAGKTEDNDGNKGGKKKKRKEMEFVIAFPHDGRYYFKKEYHYYYEAKSWAMEILNLFFNFQLYKNLHNFIYEFRWLNQSSPASRSSNSPHQLVEEDKSAEDTIELKDLDSTDGLKAPDGMESSAAMFHKTLQLMMHKMDKNGSRETVDAAKRRLEKITSENISLRKSDLPKWLLDNANYEVPDLVQNSLLLLDRYYNNKSDLFSKALKSHLLLTPRSTEVFDSVNRYMSDLPKCLRSPEDFESSPIKELTKMCWLEEEVKGCEPHQINQNIILSFGIFSDVLSYVIQNCSEEIEDQKKSILVDCFDLLGGLACQNIEIQKRLFQHLDLFLKAVACDSNEISIAIGELLHEIFSGGPSITLAIKDDQIATLMNLLFGDGDEPEGDEDDDEGSINPRPAILKALMKLLLVKNLDLPLKHNQLIVARYFSLIREDDRYWCKTLLAEKEKSKRKEILKSRPNTDSSLQNLLMVTDLLATCAYGDNPGADSVCCTIFTEAELIDIICDEEINIYRKRPFMKFLVSVYMSVQEDKAKKKAHFYIRNKNLQHHIDSMTKVLTLTSTAMPPNSSDPCSSSLSIKELLKSPSWKYCHECPNRRYHESPQDISIETNGQNFNISDVLLYLYEGFLPFLQVLYGQVYKNQHNIKLKEQTRGKSTDDIYEALINLYSPLSCGNVYFGAEIQLKLYHRSRFLVQQFVSKPQSLLKKDSEALESFHLKLKSRARKDYEEYYSKENDLNKKFGCFVSNYIMVYEGENTRKDQLECRIKDEKIATGAYSVPGPSYLPLGPAFQQHASAFKSEHIKIEFEYKVNEMKIKIEKNSKERLLQQLEISLSRMNDGSTRIDEDLQLALDINCLHILRALIYNKLILIDPELKDREPEIYRMKCDDELHPIQGEIQGLGGNKSKGTVYRMIKLLSHPNEKIVDEVLVFLQALLEAGNVEVQKGLLELKTSHDNLLFSTLRTMLRRTTIVYQESQKLIGQLQDQTLFDRHLLEKESGATRNKERTPSRIGRHNTVITVKRFWGKDKIIEIEGNHRVPFLALYQPSVDAKDIGLDSSSAVQCYDLSRVILINKVIGLMCDGQNKEMQNYLREQTESIRSINIVEEITLFLYEFSKQRVITSDTLPLMKEVFQSLIELCSGNYDNCLNVCEKQIISRINYFLQIDITEIKIGKDECKQLNKKEYEEKKEEFIELRKNGLLLKSSVIELLEILLEKISGNTEKLTRQIAEGLDIRALHFTMVDFFVLKEDSDLKKRQVATRALFKCYTVIKHLIFREVPCRYSLVPTEEGVLKAWEFCSANSHCIEIAYKNDEEEELITKVYFNVDLKVEIKESLRDTLKYQVDRSTHGDKMRDFHEWMDAAKKDTLYLDHLKRKNFSFITWLSRTRYKFLILLTVLLNIIVLVSYKVPPPSNDDNSNNGAINRTIPTVPTIRDEFRITFYVLGSVHTFFAVWMVLEFFIVNLPHFVLPKFLYRTPLEAIKGALDNFSIKWKEKSKKIKISRTFSRTKLSVNILGFTSIYVCIFLASSVLSLVYLGYFYCFCLLYIIIDNDILQRALRSVTKNGKSLLWVAILLLAILFIYAVVSFAFFQEEFNDPENVRYCQHLDECFITILRFGLIDSFLEIGVRNETSQETRNRFFFDITFFIIVATIGLNIVSGIIIDAFSELRDARFRSEQDMKSTCFICSLPSHEFDKKANDGFKKHIKGDHNMWSYIYYSIYLDQVDTSNHTAIEKYVYEKLNDKNVDYIPFNKALFLDDDDDESEEVKKELKDLHERQKAIQDSLEDLKKSLQGRI